MASYYFADEERLQQVHGITLIQFQESMNTPFGGNAASAILAR